MTHSENSGVDTVLFFFCQPKPENDVRAGTFASRAWEVESYRSGKEQKITWTYVSKCFNSTLKLKTKSIAGMTVGYIQQVHFSLCIG